MAHVDGFGFLPGNSTLHKLDPRVKLFGLAMLGLMAAAMGLPGITVLSALLIFYLIGIGIPLTQLSVNTGVGILMAAVLLTRTFSTEGPLLFRMGPAVATTRGLLEGIVFCWRLWFIAALGSLLTLTTRPSGMRAAVQWILRPLPFIPERRVSVMLGLILRFIPMVLRQARLTTEAQRARCVENRKNPLFRLTVFIAPLLRGIFLQADRMALAMEARGFSETRTDPELELAMRDRWAMVWIVILAVSILMLDSVLSVRFPLS